MIFSLDSTAFKPQYQTNLNICLCQKVVQLENQIKLLPNFHFFCKYFRLLLSKHFRCYYNVSLCCVVGFNAWSLSKKLPKLVNCWFEPLRPLGKRVGLFLEMMYIFSRLIFGSVVRK